MWILADLKQETFPQLYCQTEKELPFSEDVIKLVFATVSYL